MAGKRRTRGLAHSHSSTVRHAKNSANTKKISIEDESGQSAMEYLLTYGWAVLLIAIIASLLYLYMVVPHVIVPSSCSFSSGTYCNDLVVG
ncbi:MAG: hypothetical protein ACP5NE_00005, partial [Candidatus Micrarchaeia archaeon]